MKVIKSFACEESAAVSFEKVQDKTFSANVRTVRISSSYQPTVLYMRIIGTALILWFGTLMVRSGEITIGTLIAFTEYQFSYFMPLIDLTTVYDQYQSAMAALERMFDLIDTSEEVRDPPR